MKHKDEKTVVQVDAYTRVCLTVIAVLLTVVIIGLWADAVPHADRAVAGKVIEEQRWSTSPGKQRAEIVAAQKQTTAKLAELIAVMKSGDVKVSVTKMPTPPGGETNATGPKKK